MYVEWEKLSRFGFFLCLKGFSMDLFLCRVGKIVKTGMQDSGLRDLFSFMFSGSSDLNLDFFFKWEIPDIYCSA